MTNITAFPTHRGATIEIASVPVPFLPESSMTKQNLIIRDLPGIADLEVNLLIQRKAYDGIENDLAERAARELFGTWWEDLADFYERDDLLTTYEMTDDETMQEMLSIGVDFSDTRGHPLRCTLLLAASAEIAAKGIAGHLPDQGQATLDRIASNLERERDAFIGRKRRAFRS